MDQELISPENAAQGLLVLAALPTAMVALWSDYFGRYLDEVAVEDPEFDRAVEYQTIRLAGLVGLFLQLLLFVCSAGLREVTPGYLHFLPVIGISIQSWLQARLEWKLKDSKVAEKKKPLEESLVSTGEIWRAFIWSLAAGGLYATVMVGTLVLATLGVRWAGLGPLAGTGLMFAATVTGVLTGLGANFALSPFFMRKMMNAKLGASEAQQSLVRSVFQGSGFSVPRLYIVDPGKPFAGAVMSGLGSGKGIFTPALFLTRKLAETLNEEQLRAVVTHEMSHLKLAHLRKRLAYAGALVITVATAACTLVVLSQWLLHGEANQAIGLFTGVGAFLVAFQKLKQQNRQHEIEADAFCIRTAGIEIPHLVSALRKLHGVNEPLGKASAPASFLAGLGHPELAERIRLIESLAPTSTAAAPAPGKVGDRAA